MEQKLLAYFSKILPLSQAEIDAIVATLTIKTYPKGTILLSEGEVSAEAFFVLNGCVRQYFLILHLLFHRQCCPSDQRWQSNG